MNIVHRFANNLALKVEANARTIEQSFGAELYHYELGRRAFFSTNLNPVIPPELAGVLKNVHGLNNYVRLRSLRHPSAAVDDDQPIYKPGPFIVEQSTHSAGSGHGGRVSAD